MQTRTESQRSPTSRRGQRGRGRVIAAVLLAGACQSAPEPAPKVAVSPPPAAEPAAAAAPTPAPVESEAVLSNRRRHHAFAEQFLLLEKNQVNEFWHCLLGPDGNGYQFDSVDSLKAALEMQLATDAKAFIETARVDCVAKAFQAAEAARKLAPPIEYAQTLDRYGQTCNALAGGLKEWAVSAPRYLDLKAQEQKLMAAGDKWRAASAAGTPGTIDSMAWQYHLFLHCAVPDLDKLAGAPALLERLSSSCAASPEKTQAPDPTFLNRLRDTCLPITAAAASPGRNPAAFKHTLTRFAGDYERLQTGWSGCFGKLNTELLSHDLQPLGRAWSDWQAASTGMFELIKKAFCDGGEPKFCTPAKSRPAG